MSMFDKYAQTPSVAPTETLELLSDEVTGGLTKDYLEINAISKDLDKMLTSSYNLGMLEDKFDSIANESMLSDRTLFYATQSVNCELKSLGLEAIPGVDSIVGAKNKTKDILASIFKAIKDAILKILNSIKEFFGKLFGLLRPYKERVDKLQKEVQEKSKGKYKLQNDSPIKLPSTVISKDTKSIYDISRVMQELVSSGQGIRTTMLSISSKRIKNLTSFLINLKQDKLKPKDLIAGFKTTLDSQYKNLEPLVSKYKDSLGYKTFVENTFKYKLGDDLNYEEKWISFGESESNPKSDHDVEVDLTRLKLSVLTDMLQSSSKILEGFESSKSLVEKYYSDREKSIKDAERVIVVNDNTVDTQRVNTSIRAILRILQRESLKPVVDFDKYSLDYVRFTISMTEKILKRYQA
ncbi:MAG: hypothetical protein IBX57_00375 [Gammaproteobacteria bacterium]|nr:hypothetical protein [Gammaproteobacteria bacterium]